MKKTLTLFAFVLFTQVVLSQSTECADGGQFECGSLKDRGEIKITPLSELGCKDNKAHLYAMFPRITIYAGYVFKEVAYCNSQDLDLYQGRLQFIYCMPDTCQEITVTIHDFNDPYFQTNSGKVLKDVHLMAFDPTASSALMGAHLATSIDKFDKELIISPRFGAMRGESDEVGYLAYHANRYFIQIDIDDKNKRFTEPIQVENFLSGYVKLIKID
ncbi:hypothetical protein [Cellulophaga tyrosinoxydans]|uniref:Uncharacterized protein n=1 Tax=Cellulophaga tyrosinoxydans TaxID=504486 RepID=A0A1W1YTN3_9FLAO|nr:hypothetical protein [Cellulophaga tyrosinoxydans]SMC39462.1 hypothetical protein SAMN05660703_0863 [Cellulophaga tyrosinoxydans]